MACDTSFSDTPAHDDGLIGHGGCEMVELFVGTTSHLTEAVPMHAKSAFPEVLKEFIQKWGAPTNVMSDNACEQTSKSAMDILCHFAIGRHKSEVANDNGLHWNARFTVANMSVVCCGVVQSHCQCPIW